MWVSSGSHRTCFPQLNSSLSNQKITHLGRKIIFQKHHYCVPCQFSMYELTSTKHDIFILRLRSDCLHITNHNYTSIQTVPQRDCQVVQTFLQGRGGREHHVHLPFLKEYHKLTISQWQEALVWKGPVIIQSNNINLEWVSNQSDVHGSYLTCFPCKRLITYVTHALTDPCEQTTDI